MSVVIIFLVTAEKLNMSRVSTKIKSSKFILLAEMVSFISKSRIEPDI